MKIITWNICCLSNRFNLYQNPNNSIKHTIKVLKSCKADIICLQEVFDKNIRKRLKYEFQQYNVAYEETQHKFKINSGLMIFSKYTITNCRFHTFKYNCGEDYWANKGFLCITIQCNNTFLTLYNTHLNNKNPLFNFFQNGKTIIEQQLIQLFSHIHNKLCTNKYIYLCGDFNTDTFHMKQILNTSIFHNNIKLCGFSTQTTTNDMYNTIDHILTISKSYDIPPLQKTIKYVYNPLCSDHYAVVKTFIDC